MDVTKATDIEITHGDPGERFAVTPHEVGFEVTVEVPDDFSSEGAETGPQSFVEEEELTDDVDDVEGFREEIQENQITAGPPAPTRMAQITPGSPGVL